MIYRRIKYGDMIEGIEIAPADESSSPISSYNYTNNDSIKVLFVRMDGDAIIYDVEVPKHLHVKAPDLRRFVCDHKKVEVLVANCIKDNLYKYRFDPLNESMLEDLQQVLFIALQDLITVIDPLSIECELMPQDTFGEISVSVNYGQKNGKLRTLVVN